MAARRHAEEIGLLCLAVVGALVLGGGLLAAALFGLLRVATIGEDDPDSFFSLPSPDGAMKVVETVSSGGGAMGGYCNRTISVVPAAARNEDAAKAEFQVFAAPCASFSLRDGAMANSPIVQWISPDRLKITFSTLEMRGRLQTVRLRAVDVSKQVGIEFAASD